LKYENISVANTGYAAATSHVHMLGYVYILHTMCCFSK